MRESYIDLSEVPGFDQMLEFLAKSVSLSDSPDAWHTLTVRFKPNLGSVLIDDAVLRKSTLLDRAISMVSSGGASLDLCIRRSTATTSGQDKHQADESADLFREDGCPARVLKVRVDEEVPRAEWMPEGSEC